MCLSVRHLKLCYCNDDCEILAEVVCVIIMMIVLLKGALAEIIWCGNLHLLDLVLFLQPILWKQTKYIRKEGWIVF